MPAPSRLRDGIDPDLLLRRERLGLPGPVPLDCSAPMLIALVLRPPAAGGLACAPMDAWSRSGRSWPDAGEVAANPQMSQ